VRWVNLYGFTKSLPIGLQPPSIVATVSDLHWHIIVLYGTVSWTWHSWSGEQSTEIVQGFWHLWFTQACCDGQSESVVHSGVIDGTLDSTLN